MLDILLYIVFFSMGMAVGTIIHILVVKYYEDKNYCNELDFEFCRETLNDQKKYELRKAAFENNVGKQLDVNKIRTDKEENKVLKEAEKREMLQTINKFKEILKGNKIC